MTPLAPGATSSRADLTLVRSGRRVRTALLKVAAVGVVILLGVAGALALVGRGDGDSPSKVSGPAGYEFTVLQPDGWTAVGDAERKSIPGAPLAVLRRDGGGGLVTVNAPAQEARNFDRVAAQLDRRLRREIRDFRRVGARSVQVEAGEALLYSYARTRRGTAHTVLVVPGAERTYTVNAAVPAGAEDAAKDVGRILMSFDF
jgi:hypothetical protein